MRAKLTFAHKTQILAHYFVEMLLQNESIFDHRNRNSWIKILEIPKAIRNFLLQISRDISESRRKLVGQSVILSRVDNNGMASTKNNKKSIFATCIGVCRCGQFEKNDFHAIVRESPSLPSFTARRVQSRRKKRRRKLINNNSVHHTQTRCIRFDSILRHRPHPFQENEKSTMNAENHEKKEKISICTTTWERFSLCVDVSWLLLLL